jgi:hypothetical protein
MTSHERRTTLMQPPTIDDIRAARTHVYEALQPTPLLRHPLLAERLGLDVWVKHENHNPTGAFKVRGGLNLIARPSPQDRTRGVISATTGNHGQSIVFAVARAGASGATPTSTAICLRLRHPSSGTSARSVRLTTGPTPGTLRSRFSFARHTGLCSIV